MQLATTSGKILSKFAEELFDEARKGVFGISGNFSEKEIAEAKKLGCYIPAKDRICWGEFHKPDTFSEILYTVASAMYLSKLQKSSS